MSAQTNISKAQAGLRRARAIARAAAGRGLSRVASRVLAKAVLRAPGASGELKASGHGGRVIESNERLEATITFAAQHAAVVHEDLRARHDDGQAKFLEQSVREESGAMAATIAAEVKGALG